MAAVKRVFMVDGKPFFPLGAQSGTSNAYNDKESEAAFKAVKALHGNTLWTDVYWEHIEKEEDKFDFTMVDDLIASARRYGLKLILEWFATWKNANMDYTPDWVKTNPQRFKRVVSPTGVDLWTLSPHCQQNLEADKKAFVALCKYLKAKDSVEHTVIGLQVENEPGILGSDRDYSPEAQTIFDSPVPAKLIADMKKRGKGEVYNIWQKAGGKDSGTWSDLFGWTAGEFMSAWAIANYIDSIAAAGKAVYDIPMYSNVWVMEIHRANVVWMNPGETYPSGGAVRKALDIYKWFTPHVDMITPDIKPYNHRFWDAMCATYSRDDNPLFFSETPPFLNLFRAITDYNLIGYSRMSSTENIADENGNVRPEYQIGANTYWCLASAIPLILKYQGTGKMHAIVQEEDIGAMLLDLDGFYCAVIFSDGPQRRLGTDWRHKKIVPEGENNGPAGFDRGRGLLVQASKNEFYILGAKFRVFFRPKMPPAKLLDVTFVADRFQESLIHQLKVDEGHFDDNGNFVVDRRRNGDAIDGAIWVEPDLGIVRIIRCD
jgi:hypothetical protein